MKLLGEGGTPKLLVMSGELKSSISLFIIIPVEFDMNLEPKLGQQKVKSFLFCILSSINQLVGLCKD